MTVGEYLAKVDIDIDDCIEASDISSYYENALSFIEDNWDTDLDDLSVKQKDWLYKIRDDLQEKKLERDF